MIVIYQINSSKHYENISSQIGHNPYNHAYFYSSQCSKSIFNYLTSYNVAGVDKTFSIYNYFLSIVYSHGGKIEFNISSVWLISFSLSNSFYYNYISIGVNTLGLAYLTNDL